MKKLNVAIIGYKFMGKAHSNAWRKAPYFFDLNVEPVLKVACGRHEASLKEFADRWGWEEIETGTVTVEDAASMLVAFENGAMGSFESSRFAPGRKNYNYFEIYGDKGSIIFNLERMNELQFYSNDDLEFAKGFRTILATEECHQYIANWWPPGHIIGYEHEFVHAVVDFLNAIENDEQIEPNFYDGMKTMEILEAGLQSAAQGKQVELG